jgi:hypothetical protein
MGWTNPLLINVLFRNISYHLKNDLHLLFPEEIFFLFLTFFPYFQLITKIDNRKTAIVTLIIVPDFRANLLIFRNGFFFEGVDSTRKSNFDRVVKEVICQKGVSWLL